MAITKPRRAVTKPSGPLFADALRRIDAWWRAANHLSVGQIYLQDDPLVRKPLVRAHVKPRLLGHRGTTPTPFDMVVMNDLDRFHLVSDVIDRLPQLGPRAAYAKQAIRDRLIERHEGIREHGEDLPGIRDWRRGAPRA